MATPRTGKKDKSLRNYLKDFPGGPVAKTPRSQYRRPVFDTWSGTEIFHATTKVEDPMCLD